MAPKITHQELSEGRSEFAAPEEERRRSAELKQSVMWQEYEAQKKRAEKILQASNVDFSIIDPDEPPERDPGEQFRTMESGIETQATAFAAELKARGGQIDEVEQVRGTITVSGDTFAVAIRRVTGAVPTPEGELDYNNSFFGGLNGALLDPEKNRGLLSRLFERVGTVATLKDWAEKEEVNTPGYEESLMPKASVDVAAASKPMDEAEAQAALHELLDGKDVRTGM